MPTSTLVTPDPATEPALLTLSADGQAYLNRAASRLLPADLQQVRLGAPLVLGSRWWLLPGVAGAVVRARADRLGYLRFRATELAAYAFAIQPAGTTLLYFELHPAGPYYQLHPLLPSPITRPKVPKKP